MKIYDYQGQKNISGERIREARVKQRMSQSELAARLQVKGVNIERDSLSRIETGARFVTDYDIVVLSEILNVNALWLLGIAG